MLGSPVEGQPPVHVLEVHSSPFLQQRHHHIRMTLLSSTEEGCVLVLVEGVQVGGGLRQGRRHGTGRGVKEGKVMGECSERGAT